MQVCPPGWRLPGRSLNVPARNQRYIAMFANHSSLLLTSIVRASFRSFAHWLKSQNSRNSSAGCQVTSPSRIVGSVPRHILTLLLAQVFLQPFMAFVEKSAYDRLPQLKWEHRMGSPRLQVTLSPFRLLSRTLIVCFTTFLVGIHGIQNAVCSFKLETAFITMPC